MDVFSLSGKTILVTGASSGIGKSIALECSKMGAQLFITGRNEERLVETFSQLEGKGHQQYLVDLIDLIEVEKFIDTLPKLDGVVSNAGIVKPLMLQLTEITDIDEVMQINTLSAIHLIRLLIKKKKLNKGSSIIFISSINGTNCSSVGSTIYAASKSALNGFMKGVALELAPRFIRANCISPGMIETDLLKDGSISDEDFERDRQKYPLKRYGKPEEVAYAAIYLLSDAATWVTGSILLIDGGYTLQ